MHHAKLYSVLLRAWKEGIFDSSGLPKRGSLILVGAEEEEDKKRCKQLDHKKRHKQLDQQITMHEVKKDIAPGPMAASSNNN